jgi:hypothetical protein
MFAQRNNEFLTGPHRVLHRIGPEGRCAEKHFILVIPVDFTGEHRWPKFCLPFVINWPTDEATSAESMDGRKWAW